MKDSLRTIIFAALLGTVCAGLLTAANYVLGPYQKANEAAAKLRNVFGVLDAPYEADANSTELVRLVKSKDSPDGIVTKATIGDDTSGKMTVFSYEHPKAGRLYAVEFRGSGMWAPIEGLLCLRSDLTTIYNITFYKQEETPRRGAESAGKPEPGRDTFRGQFPGKTIAGAEPGIIIRPGGASGVAGDNEVDGISGATITCGKVKVMINAISERIAENRDEIRDKIREEILKEVGNE